MYFFDPVFLSGKSRGLINCPFSPPNPASPGARSSIAVTVIKRPSIPLTLSLRYELERVRFTMGRPFPPSKLPLRMGGAEPPSNTWFPGPTRVLNPNGISIGSAVFAGLTTVKDRQTDRPRYSVSNNTPHLRKLAMRPNNY